jgi:RNA polymerase sigma factor (TIGR02999 family)
MSDVTGILARIEHGDPSASEHLLPLVYDELRKLAAQRLSHESPGQTLQATALVHEAYLRLVESKRPGSFPPDSSAPQRWESRGHFFAAAAEAMRRILVNRARDKKRLKRGGRLRRMDLEAIEVAFDTPDDVLLSLDEALERLSAEDSTAADLVKLRFFAGLTMGQVAQLLGMPQRTAERQWAYARAWLYTFLRRDNHPDD